MPQATTGNNIRLGLFVAAGLGCLLAILFLLGRRQSVFSRKIVVRADFRNVSGLIPGNNVRLGGITVGIIKKIRIINDTTVRVEMSLDRDVRPFVHRNTIAAIGTDGLVGNHRQPHGRTGRRCRRFAARQPRRDSADAQSHRD